MLAMPSFPASFPRRLSQVFKPAADREPPSPFFTPGEIGRLHRATLECKNGPGL